jgi:hypothetical protein
MYTHIQVQYCSKMSIFRMRHKCRHRQQHRRTGWSRTMRHQCTDKVKGMVPTYAFQGRKYSCGGFVRKKRVAILQVPLWIGWMDDWRRSNVCRNIMARLLIFGLRFTVRFDSTVVREILLHGDTYSTVVLVQNNDRTSYYYSFVPKQGHQKHQNLALNDCLASL